MLACAPALQSLSIVIDWMVKGDAFLGPQAGATYLYKVENGREATVLDVIKEIRLDLSNAEEGIKVFCDDIVEIDHYEAIR